MTYKVEMRNIRKTFPGIVANDDVSLGLNKGEIHALLGENGAGKSTLMSILFGLYQADRGRIFIDGIERKINNPREATKYKIGMVHQHFKLVNDFTVTENIVLGMEDVNHGQLTLENSRKKILELSEHYGLNVDPDAKIADISVGMQQRVEILKLLYRDNEVMIFDEPTAVLTPQEIEDLLKIMRQLKDEGKAIVFITHKLNEIKEVADKVTVLRKGKYITTENVSDLTVQMMAEMMVGRKVDLAIDKKPCQPGREIFKLKNLNVQDLYGRQHVKDVSFSLREGEIVSIAGIEGNGQRELVYAIAGMMKASSGQIILNNEDITHRSIRYRNTHGLSHIPEDRHRDGLVLDYNLAYNLILKKYFTKEFQSKGFLKFDEIYPYADRLIKDYDIRSSQKSRTVVRSMSGGNQQKSILAREIDLSQDLLLAVQPTRGLDIGAIEYIHNQLIKERDAGKSILLVSYELSEVMNISDRILVMYEGEIVGEFNTDEVTQEELGLYMAGAKRRDKYGYNH